MQFGLTARVAVAMVALVLVTTSGVAALAYANLQRTVLPAELVRLDRHVSQLADEIDAHVAGVRIKLLGMAGSPRFDAYARALAAGDRDPLTGVRIDTLREEISGVFAMRLEADPSLDQLRIIDATPPGNELIRVDRFGPDDAIRIVSSVDLQPKGQRDYTREAVELGPGDVFVSGIDLNQEHGAIDPRRVPVMRVAVPLHSAMERQAAIVIANVDMRPVLERIRRDATPMGNLYVLSDDGRFLLHPHPDREHTVDLSRGVDADAEIAEVLRSGDASGQVMEINGQRVGLAMARTRPAGGPPVTVLETVPFLDLVGPVTVLGRSVVTGAVVAALAAALLGFLFARTLIRPLVQMTRAVREASSGGGYAPVPVAAAGEIGELARAYETMRDDVRIKRQALVEQVEERRRAESRFRQAIESSPNGILMVNGAGVITLANAEACRQFGHDRNELESERVDTLVPERFRAAHQDFLQDYFAAPYNRVIGDGRDFLGQRKDGTEFPVEIGLGPVDTEEGLQVLIVIVDIAARKVAEERLRHHRQTLESLLAALPDAIVVVGRDDVVRFANDAALALFARSRDDLVGGRLGLTIPERDSAEAEIERADGRRTVSLHKVPFEWDDQPAELASIRDVTDERRLEGQWRQAQKMEAIGRLAGGVAHDFNNLLTVIMGYASGLQSKVAPALSGEVEQVMAAAERASSLSRQLLLHSRSSPGAAEPMSVTDVIADLEPMVRRVIGADLEFEVKLAPESWPVYADPVQIEQVVLNLVLNARDAMPDGGHLLIQTGNLTMTDDYAASFVELEAGDYVLLTVSDTGCGMDALTQQHIFEPYFTTKSPDKGTGLGLATSYGVIKQAGGHVSVYSEVGIGTTFKVYLPRCLTPVSIPKARRESVDAVSGSRGTILLVEDNDGVRALASRVLRDSGYEVLEAADGEQALGLADGRGAPIDLLLTDMVMPGLSGAEVAERVRAVQPTIAVLFMSGYAGNTIMRAARLPPRAQYIEKPFAPGELARRVRDVLARARTGA